MKELLRSTDMVLLSYIPALFRDAGIFAAIADGYVSAVEGSIGVFPRRVLVLEEDMNEAVSLMIDAGLGEHLSPEAAAAVSGVRG